MSASGGSCTYQTAVRTAETADGAETLNHYPRELQIVE